MESGKTILHYKILEKLGEGGMGVVYKAEDLKLKRIVALKFLPTHLMSRPRFRTRLEREAQAASSLNHPNICPVYAYHETEDSIFLVMEYIEGETLKQLIEREGPLPQERAIEIITQVAEALAVAHQNGIIHRDIKSDNIMIAKDGQVKVMDFGLAKLKDAPTITQSGFPIGTVAYMSPELVQGKEVDHRTDLWSLGVVLFEMVTGELPFKGESDVGVMYAIVGDRLPKLTKYDAGISNSLQYICTTLLEKNTSVRYKKAEDVLDDLKRTVKASMTKLAVRKVRKNYRIISIAIISLLLFLFVANYYYQTRLNIPPWLKKSATITAIVSNVGDENGTISSNGKFVVYRNATGKLSLKDMFTGSTHEIIGQGTNTYYCPIWLGNEQQIACINEDRKAISIVNLLDSTIKVISQHEEGEIFHISSSPNGKWISYQWIGIDNSENIGKVYLVGIDRSESRMLLERKPVMGYYLQTAWYPDGKRLAFYDFSADSSQKFIFTLEIEKQKIFPPIIELKNKAIGWALGGLAYSPDGKYLIFPDVVQDHLELVALPVTKNGAARAGAIAPLTKFSGGGIPSNPSFAQKGDQISFCLISQNEDIGIASIDLENSRFAENENLITNYKGMDLDACWSNDGKIIAFISNRDGFEDIYSWSRQNNHIRKLNVQPNTQNNKRYAKGFRTINTVRFIPNKNSVSYLLNGTLFEFNSDSNKSKEILPKANAEMSNYAWGKKTKTIFALMLESNFPDYGYLVKINTNDEKFERIIDDRLFLDWSSIAISSNENYLAIRYALPDKQRIEIINTKNKRRKILTEHSTQVPTGDISWSPDGKFLIYGEWNEENEFQIFKIDIESGQRNLLSSRSLRRTYLPGQISPGGNEIIFYVDDYDSDIWLIKG